MGWPWKVKTNNFSTNPEENIADRLEEISFRVNASAQDLKNIVEELRTEAIKEQW